MAHLFPSTIRLSRQQFVRIEHFFIAYNVAEGLGDSTMRGLDFSSWEGMLTTLLGLVVITFVMVAIRLLIMQTVQQRRERENRQINERLRTLIAAYKVLGGSFTGILTVDPTHLRDLLRRQTAEMSTTGGATGISDTTSSSDRSRRIRDAVEAALSDVILLGTEQQMRLAATAANDLIAGKTAYTDKLVASLRDFIREVLDLEPVPADLIIPSQGPSRTLGGSNSGKDKGGGEGGNKGDKGDGDGGMAIGGGFGASGRTALDSHTDEEHESD
jgi:heme exporter protein D